jgi:hypothetical protein
MVTTTQVQEQVLAPLQNKLVLLSSSIINHHEKRLDRADSHFHTPVRRRTKARHKERESRYASYQVQVLVRYTMYQGTFLFKYSTYYC